MNHKKITAKSYHEAKVHLYNLRRALFILVKYCAAWQKKKKKKKRHD